jgi:hypothetical protein
VGILERGLRSGAGWALDLPATRRWAEWAVREALRQIEEERERREAEEEFIRKLLREREEARRAWEELLERGKTSPAVFGRDNLWAMSLSPEEREKLRSALLNWVRVCRQKYPAVEPGELRAMWNEAVQTVFRPASNPASKQGPEPARPERA